MKVKPQNDLLAITILSGLLILLMAFLPYSGLRAVLGLPLLLFFPGYTLAAALFAVKGTLRIIERIALSFGLSIAVVALMGLILKFAWEISLYPVLVSCAIFTVAISIVAWYRRLKLPDTDQFTFTLKIRLPQWSEAGRWDRALSVALLVAILGTVGALAYMLATPDVGEKFTEFYILASGGNVTDYPKELAVGEKGAVTVGIINREHETVVYRVELYINGVKVHETEPVRLQNDDKWEKIVSFTFDQEGDDQIAEFLLYRQEHEGVYRELNLRVDVTDNASANLNLYKAKMKKH